MTPRLILSFGLSALLCGGGIVGCTAGGGGVASASDRNAALAAKGAARDSDRARRALADHDAPGAAAFAESAVQLAPRDAGYRMLLGQAYLQAGRFASARDTFADVLRLTPRNGRAALNLALAQVATGDWAGARATLDAHAAIIPVSDRGLATALAGDPAAAVALLTDAARTPGADAKVRQNLALSYALAGRWDMARVVAAADMSPADVGARMEQWAAFAQPRSAADQVAGLLGVTPVVDDGRPVALALAAATPVVAAARRDEPVPNAAAFLAEAPPVAGGVVFGPRLEVAQPLAPTLIRASTAPAKVALARDLPLAEPRPTAVSADWYVQIGAFSNVAIARSGWTDATRRFAALSGHQPNGTRFVARQGALYRLSVGGFSRGDADRLCRRYRTSGGACFVRREAGDRMAQWLRAPIQVAAR